MPDNKIEPTDEIDLETRYLDLVSKGRVNTPNRMVIELLKEIRDNTKTL